MDKNPDGGSVSFRRARLNPNIARGGTCYELVRPTGPGAGSSCGPRRNHHSLGRAGCPRPAYLGHGRGAG
ncbi:hypothetical protein ARTHRO9V_20095 [Arthrobacter sp. 9V]|nr:hypothetical protein ARTHRO9V_20095 [Arthrobacter sp. 9V]